jgi:hypothetical protein
MKKVTVLNEHIMVTTNAFVASPTITRNISVVRKYNKPSQQKKSYIINLAYTVETITVANYRYIFGAVVQHYLGLSPKDCE